MPELLAYLVHWPDWPPGWDAPQSRPHVDEVLELPHRLSHKGGKRVALVLSDDELAVKQAALEKYRTQLSVMGPFLTAFVRRTEPYMLLQPAEMERVAEVIEKGVDPLHPRAAPHPHGRR